MALSLSLFGLARLHQNGETTQLKLNKPLSLLYFLAAKGDWVGRSELAFLYFPDISEANAVGNTRKLIFRAKKLEWANLELEQKRLRWLVDTDLKAFQEALEKKDFEKAVSLYSGEFLQGLSVKDAPGFETWLAQEREAHAKAWRQACLGLAASYEEKQNYTAAAESYQKVLDSDALNDDAIIGLMHSLQANSSRTDALAAYEKFCAQLDDELGIAPIEAIQDLAMNIRAEAGLAPLVNSKAYVARLTELSENARKIFLCLALQDKPNLSIVRNALNLTLGELSEANEELIQGEMIDHDSNVLAQDQAEAWLADYPTDQQPLILALARNTKSEKAYGLYKRMYSLTQGFGGMGDLLRARKAYLIEAQKYMTQLDFQAAVTVLSEARVVAEHLDADADAEAFFTEAYALERMGQFKEALKLLKYLDKDEYSPNSEALLSVLLWRTGKSKDAKDWADKALKSDLDWLWAKGVASNTLGYIGFSQEAFLEAASRFKKAASFFQAANEQQRWVGSLNNHAIVLDRMSQAAEEEKKDQKTIDALRKDAEQAYFEALEAQEASGDNDALKALILLNIGMLWERRKDWEQAKTYNLQALPFAQASGALDALARIYLNLGSAYHQLNDAKQAKTNYQEAISNAAKAGEYYIQGMATANLASLNEDPDAFEVALELLEQSGDTDKLSFFQQDYEAALKLRLLEALNEDNALSAEMKLLKLIDLYEKLAEKEKYEVASQAQLMLKDKADFAEAKLSVMAMLKL